MAVKMMTDKKQLCRKSKLEIFTSICSFLFAFKVLIPAESTYFRHDSFGNHIQLTKTYTFIHFVGVPFD